MRACSSTPTVSRICGSFSPPTAFLSRSSPSRTRFGTWYLARAPDGGGLGRGRAMDRLSFCRRVVYRTRCGGVPVCRCGIERLDAVAVAMFWGTARPAKKLPTRIRENRVPSWSSPAMRRSPPWCMIASARLATALRSLVRQMRWPTNCRIKAVAMRCRRLFSSWPTDPVPVTRPNSPLSKSLHWRECDTGRRAPLRALGHHL